MTTISYHDKQGDIKTRLIIEVPDKVKASQFGCCNCLWASVECKSGSMYQPKGTSECKGYTYYD